jgi:hypothetical protein
MRHRTALLSAALVALVACGNGASKSSIPADDSAIAEVVLKDFAEWKEATFGEQPGVLAVAPATMAQPDLTAEQVVDLAPNIRAKVTHELAAAFVERNRVATPVSSFLGGTRWAEVRPIDTTADPRDLPPGIKASGHIALPGINPDDTSALVQISHTWSIHGAVVTYVLSKEQGEWRIVARDQAVFQ